MKYLYFLSVFLGISITSFTQTKIELTAVSQHIGDSVKLEGKIFGVKTFPGKQNAPTLLNLGADFPHQLITIAVFDSYKTETILMPTENNKGDIAIVTGRIELYRGKPQIVVRSTNQLYISSALPVSPVK